MATLKLIKYRVEGWGAFPVDQLRYEQAWPARTDDAVTISSSQRLEGPSNRGTYYVDLLSYRREPSDRWESFGFAVTRLAKTTAEFWS